MPVAAFSVPAQADGCAQRDGGALGGVGEDRQRLRGLGGFPYSGTPDGEVGRLAGPVTRFAEAPLRGRGTAETDEDAHGLPMPNQLAAQASKALS